MNVISPVLVYHHRATVNVYRGRRLVSSLIGSHVIVHYRLQSEVEQTCDIAVHQKREGHSGSLSVRSNKVV